MFSFSSLPLDPWTNNLFVILTKQHQFLKNMFEKLFSCNLIYGYQFPLMYDIYNRIILRYFWNEKEKISFSIQMVDYLVNAFIVTTIIQFLFA